MEIYNIAGWSTCPFYRQTESVLKALEILLPNQFKVIKHQFETREEYRKWLIHDDDNFRNKLSSSLSCDDDPRVLIHSASPICWTTTNNNDNNDDDNNNNNNNITSYIGGYRDTIALCRDFLISSSSKVNGGSNNTTAIMVNDGYKPNHEYDYDLIVIGGGSGGLAASKEASSLGAKKVAVLDFVKPSPHGTSWGLGGTCVNVGCIPKKLMHNAALIQETIHDDSKVFGINVNSNEKKSTTDEKGEGEEEEEEEDEEEEDEKKEEEEEPICHHDWNSMRDNIQNKIKRMNFNYKVNLRDANVEYLNKYGTFINEHTLQVTDKHGVQSNITSARFIIAVGGRPTPLRCEGSELAITSDDIFALDNNPGKVLCVGAAYISLECAGFLAALGHDVTVAVRSILLRGFDRECANKIGDYMKDQVGVKFKYKVVPKKLEKVGSGGDDDDDDNNNKKGKKIRVTLSDDSQEEYDTVLVAIGRTADTDKLGLENVNIDTNPRNHKISTTNEQTSCPNIYAIGDCMENCPELTPVAIEAGLALAKRLFGTSKRCMDYTNICTTVFTPIEYGCVGLSEEDALEKYDVENIDVYHKSFYPLEWTLSEGRQKHQAFTKVIVHKEKNNRVLGIHYLGPNAGEVMQGYGVAMKRGITFQDLIETVGIHPTSSEEIVTLKVTKSSGLAANTGGC